MLPFRPTLLIAILAVGCAFACSQEKPPLGESTQQGSPAEFATTQSIQAALADHRGQPVVLNFWALW